MCILNEYNVRGLRDEICRNLTGAEHESVEKFEGNIETDNNSVRESSGSKLDQKVGAAK